MTGKDYDNMKIYYAHHLWKYNTDIEKYELDLIKRHFPFAEIVNPNGFIDQNNSTEKIMKDCLAEVDNCDALVFSTLSGVVGKGLVDEVKRAQLMVIPVLQLMNYSLYPANHVEFIEIYTGSNRTYAIVKEAAQ